MTEAVDKQNYGNLTKEKQRPKGYIRTTLEFPFWTSEPKKHDNLITENPSTVTYYNIHIREKLHHIYLDKNTNRYR